jgi:hypothetical protein
MLAKISDGGAKANCYLSYFNDLLGISCTKKADDTNNTAEVSHIYTPIFIFTVIIARSAPIITLGLYTKDKIHITLKKAESKQSLLLKSKYMKVTVEKMNIFPNQGKTAKILNVNRPKIVCIQPRNKSS